MLVAVVAAMKPSVPPEALSAAPSSTDWLESVRRHVAGLRYGVVQVTVHDGRVVQVERTERFRFEASQRHPSEPANNQPIS